MKSFDLQPSNFHESPVEDSSRTSESLPIDAVDLLYEGTLKSESFEDVALKADSLEALYDFRRKNSVLPLGSFHELVEVVTNTRKLPLSKEEIKERLAVTVETMRPRTQKMSPRVADFFQGMLAEVDGTPYQYRFDDIEKDVNRLRDDGDLQVFFSAVPPSGMDEATHWAMKSNRIEKRLVSTLAGLKALDKRDGNEMTDDIRQWRKEELKKAPTRPPKRRNESQPGVDPMERLKEGERAPAIWSIYPAWGGYFKEQSFSVWDNLRNVWTEGEYTYSDVEIIPLSGNQDPKKGVIDITMNAKILADQWVSLPIPYTHGFHAIEAGGKNYLAKKDQNGDLVILVEGDDNEEIAIKVILAPDSNKKFTSKKVVKVPNMLAEFSTETDKKLQEILEKKITNFDKAKLIMSYVINHIQYLAPKDRAEAEYYNNFYRTSKKGFAGAVDEIRKGDCDVVNTYFAALCAKLKIPVRHCVGHSVKGKDEKGSSNINSGTGHGWSEVWDEIKKVWARMDATPAGDPNLGELEKKDSKAAPGDYGGREAVRPTDEQLEDLRQKLSNHKTELSYTKEERHLAEAAGVELKQARRIVKEIYKAEQTRLPGGELVTDALSRVFNAIIESRKIAVPVYDGPLRKREGGEVITSIVRHKIGILSGETDPMSRDKLTEEKQEEKLFGGFDFYIIGDKSGSMGQSVNDEKLLEMQRQAEYLIFSSLHRFERNLERAGLQEALSVRTQGVSFRADTLDDLDLDKPLSTNFSAEDKVRMWNSLSEQGSGNGDVMALSYIYEQIAGEINERKKSGIEDKRLRLVVACSDGGPDSPHGIQMLIEKLSELNVMVVGIGLTETAAAVPIIYDTPYSRGDIVYDINDLPRLVAKHIVMEAIKLFPEKMRGEAKKNIEDLITKF